MSKYKIKKKIKFFKQFDNTCIENEMKKHIKKLERAYNRHRARNVSIK